MVTDRRCWTRRFSDRCTFSLRSHFQPQRLKSKSEEVHGGRDEERKNNLASLYWTLLQLPLFLSVFVYFLSSVCILLFTQDTSRDLVAPESVAVRMCIIKSAICRRKLKLSACYSAKYLPVISQHCFQRITYSPVPVHKHLFSVIPHDDGGNMAGQ